MTSRAGRAEFGGEPNGFTLIEIICVLAIVAILAAIALPAFPYATSRPRLEGYALQTAAIMNADHNAARRHHTVVETIIDAPMRAVRSGATGRVVRYPADVTMQTILAQYCNHRPAGSTIRYFASGMSCGGAISLTRGGSGFQVRVNWLTGGVEVVPVN